MQFLRLSFLEGRFFIPCVECVLGIGLQKKKKENFPCLCFVLFLGSPGGRVTWATHCKSQLPLPSSFHRASGMSREHPEAEATSLHNYTKRGSASGQM